ncbi:MAG: endolytic transglycosylase MltG [Thermoanaerobaculia bacterium]|nr:endolytic transglycosylase MltG [Thermoanaerobaculia bacterium]
MFAVAAGWFAWKALVTPYKGFEGDEIIVEIERGWTSERIMQTLREKGVLRDEYVPLAYLKLFHSDDFLKAGHYRFEGQARPVDIVMTLLEGKTLLSSVTIREGLDRFEIARIMSDAGFGSTDQWERATSDPTLILDLAPEADSLEGYLFPDTYLIAPGSTAQSIVEQMVSNFRSNFGDELAYIDTDLSVHETVTLASIVETEARLAEERALIAGVYLNRVQKGMLLQADPTVIYALKLRDDWDGNIKKSDLKIESPYNTYRNRGLPPGPIANPGLASLQAASRPARTEFLYFVSRNDGSHVFARNLREHNRNVHEYQRLYWREKRRQEAEEARSKGPTPAEQAE